MIDTILLNRYRIDSELGRGGMGVVYQALDMLLDRPVAVKVLNDTQLNADGRARLLREAQAAARLNHPNIVTIHDVGESDGSPFIVMELIEGKPLSQIQPMSISGKITIAKQICAALEHAHEHGVIHRDLKPDNIFVLTPPAGQERDVRVKLMDFGLAQTADRLHLTQEGAIIGTIFYMAPEIIQGRSASPQSDLYALGVVLYELFAGRLPFTGDNLMAIASQHLYAPVVPPSTYDSAILPPLDEVVVQLLGKHPDDRPASAATLLQPFEQIVASYTEPGQGAFTPAAPGPVSLLNRIARGRFIVRQAEMEAALHLWQQAACGEGHVLLVSGEPGVGKTRFVRELMLRAQLAGATVLLGECFAEGAAPYAPIIQSIASTDLTSIPPVIAADLLAIVPALRTTYPNILPNPPLETQAERQRMMDHVASFFALLCERAPLLLFIDDIHWADSDSLFLLHHLARRARTLRMLIVLTYREEELNESHPLYRALHELNRERLATRLKLPRFDRDQTQALLSVLFQETARPDFLDGIFNETDGNPFFIEEVCKALIESGQLYREKGTWRWPGMDQIEIPQSIRVAIDLRVARLPEPAQDTLRAAAILGREFAFDVLRAMTEIDEDMLIESLEAAERAQLISENRRATVPSYAFVHTLIPLALQEGLSTIRRQRLHRRAAQAIERAHAGTLTSGDFAAALGQHYQAAGDLGKAAGHYLQAAERARRVYAYHEAIDHYRSAFAILREQGPAELARAAHTIMILAQLYHTVFDFEHSQQAYQAAFALWQRDEEEQRKTDWLPEKYPLRLTRRAVWCLDSTATDWVHDTEIILQLFRGLVEITPQLDVVPDLARSWDVLDNGCRYVFHLRSDARWSDGQTVTAYDFECAWKYQLDPAHASPNKELLFDIKHAKACYEGQVPASEVGIRAIDDLTLEVELEKPVGHFISLLACTPAFAIPRHKVEAHGAQWATPGNIVTNGPFGLETWLPDDRIVLTRNPHYHGRTTGNVSRVELTISDRQSDEDHIQAYEADRLDICGFVQKPEQYQGTSESVVMPGASTYFLFFNTQFPPFNDKRVRQALAHAIDRARIAEVAFCDSNSSAVGGFTPPSLPGYTAGIGLTYEPARARNLLAEAGYPDGCGFPTITGCNWIVLNPSLSSFLQQQWLNVLGINIPIILPPENIYYVPQVTPETPIGINGWNADYSDPHNFLSVAVHRHLPIWHNEEYEQLLDLARQTTDTFERIHIYQVADRMLMQEAVIVPLIYSNWPYLIKPWVKRFTVSPLLGFFFKDMIIEPHEIKRNQNQ